MVSSDGVLCVSVIMADVLITSEVPLFVTGSFPYGHGESCVVHFA